MIVRKRNGFIRECRRRHALGQHDPRRRGRHDFRLHRVQSRSAVDRCHQRDRLLHDGSGRPRTSRPGPPFFERVPRMVGRLRGARRLSAVLHLSGPRSGQGSPTAAQARRTLRRRERAARAELSNYLHLAEKSTVKHDPFLAITHGLSGSGKTFGSQVVVEQIGAIRLRSDIERKRLAGLGPLDETLSGVGSGLYSSTSTAARSISWRAWRPRS